MEKQNRRRLLQVLATAPGFLVAGVKSVLAGTQAPSNQTNADYPHRYVGVSVVRLLNTAQAWHRNAGGAYAGLPELHNSSALQRLRDWDEAERVGIGKTLIDSLNFDSDEIVPGWALKFHLFEDRAGYFMTLKDLTKTPTTVFSTDHIGLIYEGVPLPGSKVNLDSITDLEEFKLRSNLRPLAASPHRNKAVLQFVTRTLTMFACLVGCQSCSDPPCCHSCGCTCMDSNIDQLCVNCGCESCYWCCTPW
jgi:hypothetical protein